MQRRPEQNRGRSVKQLRNFQYLQKFILLLSIVVIIEDSFAQNLIPNSSFESFNTSFVIENWIQFRSADFFNTNWNTVGSQWDKSTQPHSGKSFCGISLKGGQENLSEYIAISLKEPLFENQEYVFSCYLHNSCLLYTSDAADDYACRSRWSPYH